MKEGCQTAKVLAPLIGSMEVRGRPANPFNERFRY